jgi:hypothetical protein
MFGKKVQSFVVLSYLSHRLPQVGGDSETFSANYLFSSAVRNPAIFISTFLQPDVSVGSGKELELTTRWEALYLCS